VSQTASQTVSQAVISDDEILTRVRKVVSETLDIPPEQISLESRFAEDLGADSFDNLSLFMLLEEEFGSEISEEAATELTSVGSTVGFIRRHLAAGEGAAPA